MDGATIVTNVISQSGTDASRAVVLSLLNEQYLAMIVQARWVTEVIDIGPTVAGTDEYLVADTLVEVISLKVNGELFDQLDEGEWDKSAWDQTYYRQAGAYGVNWNDTGQTLVQLLPAPTVDGYTVQALATASAIPILDSATSFPIIPEDMHGSLIDGTTALVLLRVDERPDLAGPFQQRFEGAIVQLRQRKISKGGKGNVVRALIQGIHFR
jgi:hypothetical protein